MLVSCPSCGHQIIPYLSAEACRYKGVCTVCQAEIELRLVIAKISPLPADVLESRRMKGAKVEYDEAGNRKASKPAGK